MQGQQWTETVRSVVQRLLGPGPGLVWLLGPGLMWGLLKRTTESCWLK